MAAAVLAVSLGALPLGALEPDWFNRQLDPRSDAEFLGLAVDDGGQNDLWLVARRYHGAKGESAPFYELWRYEGGKRTAVHAIPVEREGRTIVGLETVRRIEAGEVAVGFLGLRDAPIVLLFDPAAGAFREWAEGLLGPSQAPVSDLAIHPDGEVTVALGGRGLSELVRFGADGEERWRLTLGGKAGEVAQVADLEAMGSGVVVLGPRGQAPEAASREPDSAVVFFDADGRSGTDTEDTEDAAVAVKRIAGLAAGLVPAPEGQVSVAMDQVRPGVGLRLTSYGLEAKKARLGEGSATVTLPTATRRNRHLAFARVCGGLYAYADEEEADGGAKVIRFALADETGELAASILPGPDESDRKVLSSISLVPHGDAVYVASTVVRVLETREIRSGIDLYRLDLSAVCVGRSDPDGIPKS